MNKIKNEDAPAYTATASNEDIAIASAIAICKKRLRELGQTFSSPDTVKNLCVLSMSHLEAERFDVLFLTNQHQLIENVTMFTGTIDGASVYPREVAKKALELNAAAVILAHNHPSGLLSPSNSDRTITAKLKETLGLFEIRVLDHIIVAGVETYSFAEHGLI